ncbi:MAG TPA: hypothetical protein VF607_04565, partial [Verrucomicrobiae bacterium]
DDAAVLEALVDNAHFTSVIAADGQMMTEMSLRLRNNGRQFIKVQLPPDAQVWSAFIAGQPVQPSLSGGYLLLPIQASGGEETMTVEVTYVGTNIFPRTRGDVGFRSPTLDLPVKNARWEVYLPANYRYLELPTSTMTRELAPVEGWSLNFSQLDYSRKEQALKASAKTEMRKDVSEARQQLAGGKFREATANYNRVLANAAADKADDQEFKKLAQDLQAAQASNLIQAQTDFINRNVGDLDGEQANALVAPQVNSTRDRDNQAAGEQWAKLQQAQAMVAAKVQPLRVNLPELGQHLVFNQVLQTEGGKAMTIILAAENTNLVHWPTRVAGLGAAFLGLWLVVSVWLRRLTRTSQPHMAA